MSVRSASGGLRRALGDRRGEVDESHARTVTHRRVDGCSTKRPSRPVDTRRIAQAWRPPSCPSSGGQTSRTSQQAGAPALRTETAAFAHRCERRRHLLLLTPSSPETINVGRSGTSSATRRSSGRTRLAVTVGAVGAALAQVELLDAPQLDAVGARVPRASPRSPRGRGRRRPRGVTQLGRRDGEHARPAAQVDYPPRAPGPSRCAARAPPEARAAARGSCGWSDGRRCRTPGRGRSRGRARPRAAAPRAGAPIRGRRRAPARGRRASAPPSRRPPGWRNADVDAAHDASPSASAGSSPGAP